MQDKPRIGLFLGRFQPLHNGHRAAILESATQVDKLYIGIGSSQESKTERNPFSGEDRLEMMRAVTKDVPNVEIILIPDIPNQDDKWVEYLEERYPKFDVIFTGNPYTKELFEAKGYEVRPVVMVPDVSGTKVRELMTEGGDWQILVPAEVLAILNRIGVGKK